MDHYELIVIGSGPAGEKAAVKAAYFGHKVALIEQSKLYGGAGVVTGTLPSKTLKETALYLSGKYDKGLYGMDRDIAGEATVETFMHRKNYIIETESREVHKNLLRHKVDIFHGTASFEDAHKIRIQSDPSKTLTADFIIIATGSCPFHPPHIPFDEKKVHDSDSILNITHFPKTIAVLGAGVIGCEYATIFSTMGTKVYLINRNNHILTFIDKEIVEHFFECMRQDEIDLLFNMNVKQITVPANEKEELQVELDDGKVLKVDMFLYAAGRNGNIDALHLEKAGIEVNERKIIKVNENYQTLVPHIYAVGDVIGFPALASTSMDQGRVAVSHIFQTKDIEGLAAIVPYGIYTVPEISTVGITEEQAIEQGLSYNIGIAVHRDMPRGKIMGANKGMLKLIFTKEDLTICGVHIIGNLATELVHEGVNLIKNKKTVLDIIGKVYNFPTLHDLYKYAAYDGLSNLAGYKVK